MREFRGYEYVDGDIRIWVREEGQDDRDWKEVGMVLFEEPRRVEDVAKALGLELTEVEAQRLGSELVWPRRH